MKCDDMEFARRMRARRGVVEPRKPGPWVVSPRGHAEALAAHLSMSASELIDRFESRMAAIFMVMANCGVPEPERYGIDYDIVTIRWDSAAPDKKLQLHDLAMDDWMWIRIGAGVLTEIAAWGPTPASISVDGRLMEVAEYLRGELTGG